tara:strand:+ start:933 stop:1163 length:231 start_codon:yes stop_codon:yes gene_type:complete
MSKPHQQLIDQISDVHDEIAYLVGSSTISREDLLSFLEDSLAMGQSLASDHDVSVTFKVKDQKKDSSYRASFRTDD